MPRAVANLFIAAACVVTNLACGHEASTPSTVPNAPLEAAVERTAVPAPAVVAPTAVAPTDAPQGDPCIEVDGAQDGKHITAVGRVVVDNAFAHPTRGKTHPFILRLDTPRCAIGIDEPRVTELHLAPGEDVALKPFLGKHVRVSGDPFAAHTAWHARPIVLMATTVTSAP